jgi:hypothetical protein
MSGSVSDNVHKVTAVSKFASKTLLKAYIAMLDKLQSAMDDIAYEAAVEFLRPQIQVDCTEETPYAQMVLRQLRRELDKDAVRHEREMAHQRRRDFRARLVEDGIDPDLLP